MTEPRNRVVQVKGFGGPEQLEIVDAPLPTPGRGEVRIRVLASSLEYTDVVIRRHLYVQTMTRRPPFVMGYDLVGEIDALGEGVTDFQIGDRVADMTVVGANATYCTLPADHLVRVPPGVDPAQAAACVLSWTTAYQLLYRSAHVHQGQRVLVQGAAGAVGQALLVLGKKAGVEIWGTGRAEQAAVIRQLGATPIDYQREKLPNGFDVVFDGIGADGYRASFAALKPGGLLCTYGYTARVDAKRRAAGMVMWMTGTYLATALRGLVHGGKRTRIYSINLMRARHPEWFREDLEYLFRQLATGEINPRIAARITFEEVVDAHRRIEAGGLDGKIILVPSSLPVQPEPDTPSIHVPRSE